MLVGTGHLRALVGDPQRAARPHSGRRSDAAHRARVRARTTRRSSFGTRWSGSSTRPRCRRLGRSHRSTSASIAWTGVRRCATSALAAARFTIADMLEHRLPVVLAGLRSEVAQAAGGEARRATRVPERGVRVLHHALLRLPHLASARRRRSTSRHSSTRSAAACTAHPQARRERMGARRDARTSATTATRAGRSRSRRGNFWIRTASWLATKLFRRSVDAITVDVPSFERARAVAAVGRDARGHAESSQLSRLRADDVPRVRAARSPSHPAHRRDDGVRAHPGARPHPRVDARVLPAARRRARIPSSRAASHELIADGNTLAFFIEGARSRTGEFLEPRRGLLRCLQATGRRVALHAHRADATTACRSTPPSSASSPVSRSSRCRFAAPAVSGRIDAWRGRVDLGDIHIACGTPVLLDASSDVHAVSHEVIDAAARGDARSARSGAGS